MMNSADSLGGACSDEIAGLQGEVSGDEGNYFGDGEDHLVGVGVLHGFAVEAAGDIELLDVADVLLEHHLGADGAEGVEGFAAEPARFVGGLKVALADVVHAGVAVDVVEGFFLGDVFAGVLDDDAQLRLVVVAQVVKVVVPQIARYDDWLPGADKHIRGFGKEHRLGGPLQGQVFGVEKHALFDVLVVVETQGDNLAGIDGICFIAAVNW